jgi:hypothetical protein
MVGSGRVDRRQRDALNGAAIFVFAGVGQGLIQIDRVS